MMSDEFLVDRSGNERDLKPCALEELGEFNRVCNDREGRAWWEPANAWLLHEMGVVSVPDLPKHGEPGSGLEKRDGTEERPLTMDDLYACRDGKGDLIAVPGPPGTVEFLEPVTVADPEALKMLGRRVLADTVSAVAATRTEPAYEPLELVCGSYSSSEKPQRYVLADVRRWAAGDFADLHSTPREVIATLAEMVRALLLETTEVPLPPTFAAGVEWGRWPATGPYAIMTAMQIWVTLHERKPTATEEEVAARLEGLRDWFIFLPVSNFVLDGKAYPDCKMQVHVGHLERWARGDQRDLHADAVTAMRGLAGEVLRLSGLAPGGAGGVA